MFRPRLTMLARDQGLAPLGWLYVFKARAKNVIAQILPEPQASLLTGILLGDDPASPRVYRMPSAQRACPISSRPVLKSAPDA